MTELSLMFNELMNSLEQAFRQQQFIEDASHELKTPLSIIHGHLSMIKSWGLFCIQQENRDRSNAMNIMIFFRQYTTDDQDELYYYVKRPRSIAKRSNLSC